MQSIRSQEALDRLGVAAALTCGVHCVLAPLAVGAMAVLPVQWAFSDAAEATVLAVTVLLGALSLVPAYRSQHQRKSCMALFFSGVATLVAAKVAMHGASLEPWLLAAGAAMIAGAHLSNLHFCRSCKRCSGH